jgi:hypothetical protein
LNTTSGFVIEDDRFGINTGIPKATLDVNGNARLQNSLDVSDTSTFYSLAVARQGIESGHSPGSTTIPFSSTETKSFLVHNKECN